MCLKKTPKTNKRNKNNYICSEKGSTKYIDGYCVNVLPPKQKYKDFRCRCVDFIISSLTKTAVNFSYTFIICCCEDKERTKTFEAVHEKLLTGFSAYQ